MPAGFEVYNADGSLQFSLDNRLLRTLTVQTASGGAGSVTVAAGQGSLTAAVAPVANVEDAAVPSVSVSGNTVSWTAGTSSRINIMAY